MHAKPMKSLTDTANGGEICISRIQTTFRENRSIFTLLFLQNFMPTSHVLSNHVQIQSIIIFQVSVKKLSKTYTMVTCDVVEFFSTKNAPINAIRDITIRKTTVMSLSDATLAQKDNKLKKLIVWSKTIAKSRFIVAN